MNPSTLVVTGSDTAHFANLRVLVGSWSVHLPEWPLAVCDFGLSSGQRGELALFPNLAVLPAPFPIVHPWQGKSLIGRFLSGERRPWSELMWIDADALISHPLPPIPPLIAGYDLLLDAHRQSVGEITHDCNLAALGLRRDDAYYSAGWWTARRGCLLETYERFCDRVRGQGNLWEGDAFVAAVYAEKLKVRTVSGSVWHCRGKTSLHTCTVDGLRAFHCGQPIYVVHANEAYKVRGDGRRLLHRADLRAVQDHYEAAYLERAARLRAQRAPANATHSRD